MSTIFLYPKKTESVKMIIGDDMKKKKIIVISILSIILIAIAAVILTHNSKILKVTLDINPSIEIYFTKEEKVKKVVALNEDAKELISDGLKGKPLEKVFSTIVEKIIEKDYIEEDRVVILLSFKGKVDQEKIQRELEKDFHEKEIITEIIVIETITKEDEKLAKKYHITPAKASYIQSIMNENKNLSKENLSQKPIQELQETKMTGKYCEEGYQLEGDHCLKEIETFATSIGKVCPKGYYEQEDKCYLETPSEEGKELICSEGFLLQENKCVRILVTPLEARYNCEKGELLRKGDVNSIGSADNDKLYCIDKSTGVPPTLRCLISNHIIVNGECYVGPAPVINGGCLNGDLLQNGGCYSKDDGDQWQCPNGSIYEKSKGTYIDLCPDTFTYLEPTITGYQCPDGFKKTENECVKTETEEVRHSRLCQEGYTKTEDERCIDKNQEVEKEDGLVCLEKDTRLKNKKCIRYEIIDAKQA